MPKGTDKAKKAQAAHVKGVKNVKRKLKYTVHFRRKKTLRQPSKPKYARWVSSIIINNHIDSFIYPLIHSYI